MMRATRFERHHIFTFWLLFGLFYQNFAWSGSAIMGVSPDNSEEIVLKVIRETQESLLINIYQYDHPSITQSLSKKIRSGAHVELLIEGEPMGGVSAKGWQTLRTLQKAIDETPGSTSKIFLMQKPTSISDGKPGIDPTTPGETTPGTPATQQKRRFRFNHAKFMVSDGTRVFVSSENFTAGGQPLPGTVGNRGWSILIDDTDLALKLTAVFEADLDPTWGDVVLFQSKHRKEPSTGDDTLSSSATDTVPAAQRGLPAVKVGKAPVYDIQIVASPKSLEPLRDILRSARSQLAVEAMSMPPEWRFSEVVTNPLVSEMIQASKRGVQVRVLLNDDRAFSSEPPAKGYANDRTAQFINRIARCYQLPLEGRIVNRKGLEITYIHNKGILADDDMTLISSINGTQNSVYNNREIAVWAQSPEINRYYTSVFNLDWNASVVAPSDSETTPPDTGSDGTKTPTPPSNGFLMNPAECPSLSASLWSSALPFSLPGM